MRIAVTTAHIQDLPHDAPTQAHAIHPAGLDIHFGAQESNCYTQARGYSGNNSGFLKTGWDRIGHSAFRAPDPVAISAALRFRAQTMLAIERRQCRVYAHRLYRKRHPTDPEPDCTCSAAAVGYTTLTAKYRFQGA